MGASSSRPPFATATLARIYLAQGNRAAATAIVEALERSGTPGADGVRAALDGDAQRREAVLGDLLEAVRARRRARFGRDGT